MKSRNLVLVWAIASMLVLHADHAAKEGGTVRLAGKGRIAVVDCDSGVNWASMEKALESFNKSFHVDVVRRKGSRFSVETAENAVALANANAVVFVGSRADYPMALAASEQRWSFINVAALEKGSPNFENRCQKMLMRGIYRALGSDTSQAPNSCMSPVHSPKDLDDITDLGVAMDTYIAVNQSFESLGIVPVEYGTYREACEAGVAPMPTNEVQKAIWDKVHEMPTEPIKIKYKKAESAANTGK